MINKHYIIEDENHIIVDAWSDAFPSEVREVESGETLVLLRENVGSHLYFEVNGEKITNPVLLDMKGNRLYHWDNNETKEIAEDERISLENVKVEKIVELKMVAKGQILNNYPVYMQTNINELQGTGYDQDKKDAMWTYINDVRDWSNTKEIAIDACADKDAVAAIDLTDFPTV